MRIPKGQLFEPGAVRLNAEEVTAARAVRDEDEVTTIRRSGDVSLEKRVCCEGSRPRPVLFCGPDVVIIIGARDISDPSVWQ